MEIQPDEWNNVPLPVTSAFKTIIKELSTVVMNLGNTEHSLAIYIKETRKNF